MSLERLAAEYHQNLLRDRRLVGWALGRGLTLQTICTEQVGYVPPSEPSQLAGRVVFPIRAFDGELLTWTGRALTNDVHPKYIHGRYEKHLHLDGLHASARRAIDQNLLVLVEGGVDRMVLAQYGVPSAALLGGALSAHQAYLIARLVDRVLFLADGGEAGEKIAVAAAEILEPFGLDVRLARLAGGLDPSAYVNKYGGYARTRIERLVYKHFGG